MRKMAWIVAIVVLLVTGASGLVEAAQDLGRTAPVLQKSVTIAVLIYGMLGVVAALGLARRRTWSVPLTTVWAVAVAYAATVASFAFSDPSFSQRETLIGTSAAFVSVALLGVFVIWTARAATRESRLPRTGGADHIPSP